MEGKGMPGEPQARAAGRRKGGAVRTAVSPAVRNGSPRHTHLLLSPQLGCLADEGGSKISLR